jgi:hypothetical protein
MAGLRDQIEETPGSGIWVDSNCRSNNLVGTPLVSASSNESGEAMPDKYTLTFTSVNVGAHTATVIVQTNSPNNPYRNLTGITINIDGATVYKNVIPGLDLVFSGSSSFVNTWSTEIRIGTNLGIFSSFGDDAGDPGAWVRHRILNDTAGAAAQCKVKLQAMAIYVRTAGTVFENVKRSAPTATEKIAGGGSNRISPYHITVANVTGSGGSKTTDILVDGSLVAVQALDGSYSGTSAGLSVTKDYKITSGALQSVQFKPSSLCVSGNTANILIFPARHMQIAPDNTGTPGTPSSTEIVVTQAGESAGTVQPGQVTYYHLRANVVEGANAESNPYLLFAFLVGKQTGTADFMG